MDDARWPFVSDGCPNVAAHDRSVKGGEDVQDECQKHVCGDLDPSQGVDERAAILTPVVIHVAWH